jgi:hypothetical protein
VNILNNQSQTTDKGAPLARGLGKRLTTPHSKKKKKKKNQLVIKCYTGPQTVSEQGQEAGSCKHSTEP